jgi:hypothetical protein
MFGAALFPGSHSRPTVSLNLEDLDKPATDGEIRVETDEGLRKRVLYVADPTNEIHTAYGRQLDEVAERLGLRRRTARQLHDAA